MYRVDTKTLGKKHSFQHIVYRYIQSAAILKTLSTKVLLRNKSILDFGGGSGTFLHYLKEHAAPKSTTLYDPSKESLSHAKSLWNFAAKELISDSSKLKQYDVVTSCYVLAYVPNQKQFWQQLAEHTKPGGYCIVIQNGTNSLYNKITGVRLGRNWTINKDDIPNSLALERKIAHPHPSYLLHNYGRPSVALVGKLLLSFVEKILGMHYQTIYIYRKN